MLGDTETDTEIFGSGIMIEDDDSGYCLDDDSWRNHKYEEKEPKRNSHILEYNQGMAY